MQRRRTRDRDRRFVPRLDAWNAGCHLLAAMLIVALMTQLGRTEEAAAGSNEAGATSSSATATDSRAPAGAKDGGAGPIDTRITVQARPSTKRPSPTADVRTIGKPNAPTNIRTRVIGERARNAVGMAIPDRAGTPGPTAVPQARPAAAPTAQAGATPGLVTIQAVGSRGVPARASSVPTANISNRGAISGTGLTRLGSGPATVRGPAKAAAGSISGSSFRPKH